MKTPTTERIINPNETRKPETHLRIPRFGKRGQLAKRNRAVAAVNRFRRLPDHGRDIAGSLSTATLYAAIEGRPTSSTRVIASRSTFTPAPGLTPCSAR